MAAGVAVAAVAVTATAVAVSRPSAPASHVAAVPADGHSTAALDVVSGTRLLSVRVANLGGTSGTLLRATTPRGAPPPRLRTSPAGATDRSGDNELVFLSASSGASPVTVTLNAAVTWRLDFAAGTERTVADLRGGRVAGISITAGSDIVDLTLPRPRGTVPIVMTGGASQFLITAPAGVPVRITAGGGAGEVSLDGATHVGVAGGTVFATPGWAARASGPTRASGPAGSPGSPGWSGTTGPPGAARFDVDATAGASRVAVTRWGR